MATKKHPTDEKARDSRAAALTSAFSACAGELQMAVLLDDSSSFEALNLYTLNSGTISEAIEKVSPDEEGGYPVLAFPDGLEPTIEMMKQLIFRYVIDNPESDLQRRQRCQADMVGRVTEHYLRLAEPRSGAPERLIDSSATLLVDPR